MRTGEVILSDGTRYTIEVHIAGDEPYLRSILRLKCSNCEQVCLHCYCTRYEEYKEASRDPRYWFAFSVLAEHSVADHVGAPLFLGYSCSYIHYCMLHAVIAFGKDLLGFIHGWCCEDDAAKKDGRCQTGDIWLKQHNIKVSLAHGPSILTSSWHVKATETFELFKNFESFCRSIDFDDDVVQSLVAEFLVWMKTLYKWDFVTDEDWALLDQYEIGFPAFVEIWREEIAGVDKCRNYYHTLSVEVPKSICRWGSAWKYSSDVTETYVCVLKNQFRMYTTRGGMGANASFQVMQRLGMKTLAYIKGFANEKLMISNYELRRLDTYVQQILEGNKKLRVQLADLETMEQFNTILETEFKTQGEELSE